MNLRAQARKSTYALEVTDWTAHLPDHEREDFIKAVCRMSDAFSETGDAKPLVRLIEGWRAAAYVHSDPTLAALLGVEHAGPPAPIERPAAR